MEKRKEFLGFDRSMILQCILLYIGIWGSLAVNNLLFVVLAMCTVFVSVFSDIDNTYYHLFFTLPFTVIYKLSPTSTSLFAYLMIITGIVLLVRKNKLPGFSMVLIIMFIAYALIGTGNAYTTLLKMIAGLLLLYVFVTTVQPENFKNHIMSFSLGVLGSSIIGTMKLTWNTLSAYFGDIDTILFDGELSMRFSGLNYDPNYYCIGVVFAIFLCMMLIYNKQGNRLLLFGLIAALAYFGFSSYSKMFLLSFFLLGIIFIFYNFKTPKQIFVTLICVSVLAVFLYKWAISSGYLDIILMRLEGSDISTGRFDIWTECFSYLSEHPLSMFFGDGLGYQTFEPHNAYIELVLIFGLFGGSIFIITIFSLIRMIRHIEKRSLSHYAMLLLFFVMIGTLGMVTVNDLMFYGMLLFISLNIPLKRKTTIQLD